MSANWENRTLFHGDNLLFLRAMNSGTVDLIATDPPFKKGRDFHATPDSLAQGARFQDRWSWDRDVHQDWVDKIKDDFPAVWEVIDAANAVYMRKTKKNLKRPREEVGSDMGAYLCFMAVRLLEMHRVMKARGTLYLHCDHTASHYLKAVLDGIFGKQNFRNEIIWCYSGGGIPTKDFPRKHDTLLRYTKSGRYTYNPVYQPYSEGTVQRGRTQVKGKYYEQGLRKEGTPVPDWWVGVKKITSPDDPEKTGFKTQKSVELYSRIISISSNKGDVVLDPFCGCTTTCISAELLGRKWVGIDLWDKAHDVVLDRFRREGFAVKGHSREKLAFGLVHYLKRPPKRTDDGQIAVPFLKAKETERKPRETTISRTSMFHQLIIQNEARCQGCDRVFDDPRYLELDHRQPRSDGGSNELSNRILLCSPCNRLKSNTLTLIGLRRQNKKMGYMAGSEGENQAMRKIRLSRENAPKLFE